MNRELFACHHLGGDPVQRGHGARRCCDPFRLGFLAFDRCGDHAGADRLAEDQSIARLGSGVGEHAPRIYDFRDRISELDLRITDGVAAGAMRIDGVQARKRLEQQVRVYETKKRGSLLVQATQNRLMEKMLPRTEYYLQQLLPLLTGGRFHDARLTSSNGAWQLSVWESQAFDYIPRSALSGGTADQLSLALRLAFAIAALPRELSAAPGFLLLDEPLGASDSERARALVELVTGHLLSSHFEQIVLVSHGGVWHPALFPYRVFLDAGEVVESNLPVPAVEALVPVPSEATEEARVLSKVSYS